MATVVWHATINLGTIYGVSTCTLSLCTVQSANRKHRSSHQSVVQFSLIEGIKWPLYSAAAAQPAGISDGSMIYPRALPLLWHPWLQNRILQPVWVHLPCDMGHLWHFAPTKRSVTCDCANCSKCYSTLFRTRFSCRYFLDKPVDKTTIDEIIDVAHFSLWK